MTFRHQNRKDREAMSGNTGNQKFNDAVCREEAEKIADRLILEYGLTDSQLVALRIYDTVAEKVTKILMDRIGEEPTGQLEDEEEEEI